MIMNTTSKKIITLGITLDDAQIKRLEAIGDLEMSDSPVSVEELLHKTKGADVIYSNGNFLLDSLPSLKNVFVTYPYVELGPFDSAALEQRGVFIANAQGGNTDSVVEWVMYMALSLFRTFAPLVRATENVPFQLQQSLHGKRALIVGHGTIGSQIGVLCKAFGMQVAFFERGEDLTARSKEKDLIINALNCNSTSRNLLDASFFLQLKRGSYYISIARVYTYDIDGLLAAMDAGIIAGAAIDCDPETFGDTTNAYYRTLMGNPKVLVTPHVAFATEQAIANGREIAIRNIECYLAGNPQNILSKS
jgi:phosphoglycerate dehydrogenase-like enzyme